MTEVGFYPSRKLKKRNSDGVLACVFPNAATARFAREIDTTTNGHVETLIA
jgi:hypothetical protein